jgi:hypothetical protein
MESETMKKRSIQSWMFPLVIILLIVILGMQIKQPSIAQERDSTPTPNHFQQDMLQIIQDAQTRLTQFPGDPTEQAHELTRIAINAEAATEAAENIKNPKPTRKIEPFIPVESTIIPNPTGIFPSRPSMGSFHSWVDIVPENVWFGNIMGQNVTVFAGASGDDPNQGLLYVIVVSNNGAHYTWGGYLTPVKSGSVHIEGYDGLRLTLKTKGGDSLYFDAAALRFISSLSEIVPTITPLPNTHATIPPTWTPNLTPNVYPNPYP